MKLKRFDDMNCSLAQTLDVIGERWTLLILRDAFFGARRFSEFQRSLGVARNILSKRLNRLVDEGILERSPAADGGHAEYRLTEKGLALQPVLLAMTHWGDRYRPHPRGKRLEFVERSSGNPIRTMAVLNQAGEPLKPKEVKAVAGPALDKDWREQLFQ
ncbi:winged helix-turn-helix transcriptional regulator [Parahaliea aestuarii]|uniref:Helix-turn-helix transcriptional regulator n=1 Tax=Parahaliea aestuarii TaxID=1852021 RepID=A0A5C9A3M0_9GAMM|nr:helix-turn-helix domain-containing protein [Parahaliea aestuarii]TXS94370.1 helix-turn-helix transcriptional regulator [Parahaliea aestuarii]